MWKVCKNRAVLAAAALLAFTTAAMAVPPPLPDIELPIDAASIVTKFSTPAILVFGIMAVAGLGWALIRKATNKAPKKIG